MCASRQPAGGDRHDNEIDVAQRFPLVCDRLDRQVGAGRFDHQPAQPADLFAGGGVDVVEHDRAGQFRRGRQIRSKIGPRL
jgi:hypothetical protein